MRTWFQARNRREQMLVTAFIVMGALVWLSSASGRLRLKWTDWKSTNGDIAAQKLWLDRQKEIETQASIAVRNLDPARTLDATKLVATVTSLAAGAGLTPSIDTPVTQRTPQFAYHNAKV